MTTEYIKHQEGKWNLGWTNLISDQSYCTIDGQKNVSFYVYNASSVVDNFTTNFISMDGWSFGSKFSWDPGFTHFAFCNQHFLAYSAYTGKAGMYKVNMTKTGIETVIEPWQWSPGWTHVVGFNENFFFYNSTTGEMRYSHINTDSAGKPVSISEGVDTASWAKDWTHFTRVKDFLVVYNTYDGHVRVDKVQCTPTQYIYPNVLDAYWNAGWENIIGFTERITKESEWPKSHEAMFLLLTAETTGVFSRVQEASVVNTGPTFSLPNWTSLLAFDNVKQWEGGYAGGMASFMAPLMLGYNAYSGKYEIGSANIIFG